MEIELDVSYEFGGKVYQIQKLKPDYGYSYWIGKIDGKVKTSPETLYLDVVRTLAPGFRNPLYHTLEMLIIQELGLTLEDF